MACILDILVKYKDDPDKLTQILDKVLNKLKIKFPVMFSQNTKTPYAIKAVIDTDGSIVVLNPVRLKQITLTQFRKQLIIELDKIFFSDHIGVNSAEGVYRGLKDLSIFIVSQELFDRFMKKTGSFLKTMIASGIGGILYTLILDATIHKVMKKKYRQAIYKRYWKPLGCKLSTLPGEVKTQESHVLHEGIFTNPNSIIKGLIGYVVSVTKKPKVMYCGFLKKLYKAGYLSFGPVPQVQKLYKLYNRKCLKVL